MNSPSSNTSSMTCFMSYGLFGLSGTMDRSSGSRRSGSSDGASYGAESRLFCGMNESRWRTSSMHDSSSSDANWHTPDLTACDSAPPSSSMVTSSPVTVLITSGPVMNM